jgi:pyrimidine oxygenase
MEKEVEYGMFRPVGEGGWIRSTTAPSVPVTYAYNHQVEILAEHIGLDFRLPCKFDLLNFSRFVGA